MRLVERSIEVDTRVPEQLINDHLSLAVGIARRMSHRRHEREDVEQVAMVALVKAARRFEPSMNVRFSTYAWSTIEGEIKRYFRDHSWSVHVNRSLQERSMRVAAAVELLAQAHRRSPTVAEIAAHAECTEEHVIEVLELQRNGGAVSFDAPDDHEFGTAELGADCPDFDSSDDRSVIATLARQLAKRERAIVYLRFYEQMSQLDIAQQLGISQMHVSRLLNRALATMRAAAGS